MKISSAKIRYFSPNLSHHGIQSFIKSSGFFAFVEFGMIDFHFYRERWLWDEICLGSQFPNPRDSLFLPRNPEGKIQKKTIFRATSPNSKKSRYFWWFSPLIFYGFGSRGYPGLFFQKSHRILNPGLGFCFRVMVFATKKSPLFLGRKPSWPDWNIQLHQ